MSNSPLTVQVDLSPVATSLLLLMPLVWTILVIRRRMNENRARSVSPFKDLRRRPAGESLRLKVAALDDQINDRILLLFSFPFCLAILAYIMRYNLISAIVSFLFSVAWTLVLKGRLVKLLEERRNYQLGFDGERFVGEELSGLIARGFEIYHDVPFDGFNLDHVLVGRPGVFVVETKTRSKPVDETGDKKYKVTFDGKKLHWPWGTEEKDIEQALNNAATLSKWLTEAVGKTVGVSAILTLPGWWIDRTAPSPGVQVFNPKEIAHFCGTKGGNLDEELIRRIQHQLNERCKITIGNSPA